MGQENQADLGGLAASEEEGRKTGGRKGDQTAGQIDEDGGRGARGGLGEAAFQDLKGAFEAVFGGGGGSAWGAGYHRVARN